MQRELQSALTDKEGFESKIILLVFKSKLMMTLHNPFMSLAISRIDLWDLHYVRN